MKRAIRLSSCFTFALSAFAHAADPPAATSPPDPSSMMRDVMKREAVRLDAQFLDGITSREQWDSRRTELRNEYLEMLGLWPLPERTPLESKVTGVIERDEGFRVEKLHFQSRPHLYVTGNLYVPLDAKPGAKLPAVLYVCGHSGRGRDGNKTAFQHHGMWFATHGYVCLVIDTLQLGEIEAIHHGTYKYNRWWWQARGYTPAAVECWNGIRAIDYLVSRPEVDPKRIAVTGISGGGAATFWIAAADERVTVAVPVSGMADLDDYVGDKVVNGHCDCMFLINTFRWPWTQIAALVAPRPLLFANSGHDTIFPMNANDRIRARLEKLYRLYTDRTDRLFDIAVVPGGHEDKPALRLMAYQWINRHLKGDDTPVTEPDLPKIEGKLLRAFPDELPADQINTTIDEVFVPLGAGALPNAGSEFESWRGRRLSELKRLVLSSLDDNARRPGLTGGLKLDGNSEQSGVFEAAPDVSIPWKFVPPRDTKSPNMRLLVVLNEDESLDALPDPVWSKFSGAGVGVLMVAPRGTGPARFEDPPPFYVQRSLPLLGTTLDTCRLSDVLTLARAAVDGDTGKHVWTIAGRGRAGIIAAYAAVLEPRIDGAVLLDPPVSHRDGPIFLNVLRVTDIPEALGLLAPRPLTIRTNQPAAFVPTQSLYRLGGGTLYLLPAD